MATTKAKRKSPSKAKSTAKEKTPAKTSSAPKAASKPKHSAASLARRKAALVAELRELDLTSERRIAIDAELAEEPMASTPILSYDELRRLDG